MASEPLLDEQLLENFRKAHSYRSLHTDEQRDLLAIAEQLQVRVRAEYHDRVTLEQCNGRLAQQVKDLRAALEQEQREHANCEDANAQRFQTLTNAIIDLTQQVTTMRPIVEALANGGNAEDFSQRHMYALNYHVYASVEMCAQAQAFMAAHPAAEGGDA